MEGQNSIYLPHFTIGEYAFDMFQNEMRRFGNKVAIIYGEKAWGASEKYIAPALDKAGLERTGEICYGHEATMNNVKRLMAEQTVKDSEMLLAVGGGKCIDTAKLVGDKLGKPVFVVPTVASNCAAITKLSIMYRDNGEFLEVVKLGAVPVHCFINPRIIIEAPLHYLKAGIGDAMAKHIESEWSAKAGEKLSYGSELGILIGRLCYYPMLEFGKKAMEDAKAGLVSEALEKVLLDIIITPGIVSVSVHSDYVGGIAHALFYGLTRRQHIEQNNLHGDVVAYGSLVNLMVDEDWGKLRLTYDFNRSLGLPVCLGDFELDAQDALEDVLEATLVNQELSHTPYPVTKEMIREAIEKLEVYGA